MPSAAASVTRTPRTLLVPASRGNVLAIVSSHPLHRLRLPSLLLAWRRDATSPLSCLTKHCAASRSVVVGRRRQHIGGASSDDSGIIIVRVQRWPKFAAWPPQIHQCHLPPRCTIELASCCHHSLVGSKVGGGGPLPSLLDALTNRSLLLLHIRARDIQLPPKPQQLLLQLCRCLRGMMLRCGGREIVTSLSGSSGIQAQL